ncbi:MAG: hypothetical protein AAF541_06625 [Pseudomonadota bacterium]
MKWTSKIAERTATNWIGLTLLVSLASPVTAQERGLVVINGQLLLPPYEIGINKTDQLIQINGVALTPEPAAEETVTPTSTETSSTASQAALLGARHMADQDDPEVALSKILEEFPDVEFEVEPTRIVLTDGRLRSAAFAIEEPPTRSLEAVTAMLQDRAELITDILNENGALLYANDSYTYLPVQQTRALANAMIASMLNTTALKQSAVAPIVASDPVAKMIGNLPLLSDSALAHLKLITTVDIPILPTVSLTAASSCSTRAPRITDNHGLRRPVAL